MSKLKYWPGLKQTPLYQRSGMIFGRLACWVLMLAAVTLPAAEPAPAFPSYNIQGYVVQSKLSLGTNTLTPLFSKYTGPKVSLGEIVRAAADLQAEYRREGQTRMNIIIARKRITNGLVTLDAFPGAVEQIVVSGVRYEVSSNGVEVAANPAGQNTSQPTNSVPVKSVPAKAAPHFKVEKYFVMGNTLLPPETIGQILAHVPGAYGTNVSLDGIRAAVKGLQSAYSVRGYVTVAVGLPPQKITNATVKIQVTEGRLASIEVKGNHYFSSNNVMRSLPGLHMNMILNGLTFQAQLNQANANQDRQIYPKVQPGPDPGTTDLRLDVVDRFPLHAKVDFNNESSPGTPDLRVNSSVVYDNLWQQDQSLGVQYSFSPELYKAGSQWDWYDQPLVANSSTFYRIPLGRPTSVDDEVESNPGTFGYDEATRKFNLPPSSGRPELSFFASRSTIDTGLTTSPGQELYNTNGSVLTLTSESQSLTVNNDIGFRLSLPEVTPSGFHSDFSGGLDYKNYSLFTGKTNVYTLQTTIIDTLGGSPQTNINTSTDTSPVGVTENSLDYVPLQLRYDGTWHDALGPGSIGLGLGVNLWYDAQTSQGVNTNITALQGLKALRNIAGSTNTLGHWVVLNPSFSHQLELVPNWLTTIRADGQWASEPLISNEQFGAGGVNSVRGYQEGQVFGDTGWHVSLEQQTPAHMVGYVRGGVPLMIRGSIYTDYADTYLLDPQGRPDNTALWGTGFGAVALVGSHWEARFLFSVPMLGTASVEAYQPFFNFALTAQF